MLNSTTIQLLIYNDSTYSNCKQTQQIIYYLNTIVPLLWVIIGTVTNSLALIVFSRRTMRRNSTFIYLAIMSFSDIVTIWTSSFRDYLAYKYNIYISGDIACKLLVFSFFVFAQFSSWLLVGANLDRLICVISLNKYSKFWCTRKTATKFAICLFLIILLLNSHFLAFIETKYHNSKTTTFTETLNSNSTLVIKSLTEIVSVHPYVYPKCTLKNFSSYIIFYNNIFTWIDSSLYCLLPFIIMLICNITLIKRVFTTKRNLFLKQQSNRNNTNTATTRYSITSLFKTKKTDANLNNANRYKKKMSYNMSTSTTNNGIGGGGGSGSGGGYTYQTYVAQTANANDSSMERMRNMAITIIGVTILFIIFTVPINIYIPITTAYNVNRDGKCEDLLFSILNNMVNANHSINFFIYYMTNSKFNKEFKILLLTIRKSIFDYLNIPTGRDRLTLFQSFTATHTNNNGNLNNITTNTNTGHTITNSNLTTSQQSRVIHTSLSHTNSTSKPSKKSTSTSNSPTYKNHPDNIGSADV